jgi:hypothetical protein
MSKNITFSVEEVLIQKARMRARNEGKSLNSLFCEWVFRYVQIGKKGAYMELMKKLDYVRTGKKFSRDELNER